MKHVNHILVIFNCTDETGSDEWETSDMFDVNNDISLKNFVDTFFDVYADYDKKIYKIITAHVVTQSYSPEYKDD